MNKHRENNRAFSWISSVTLLLVASCVCAQSPQSKKTAAPAPECIEIKDDQPDVLDTKTFDKGRVEYKGISFSFSPKLMVSVVAETRSAKPLECIDYKPSYENYPEHPAFKFKGGYAAVYEKLSENEWQPEIRIYPIAEYQQAFAIANVDGKEIYVSKSLAELKRLLASPTPSFQSFGGQAPFALYMDAHQAFQTKAHFIDFANGKGVFYLTEWDDDEASVITNQGLLYIFQGLTNDGKYLVSATFPVKVPFLPENMESVDEKSLPFNLNLEPDEKLEKAKYKRYVAQIVRKLESLPSKEFSVDLALFDELIKSLRVDYRK